MRQTTLPVVALLTVFAFGCGQPSVSEDEALRRLWVGCVSGDRAACEVMFQLAEPGTDFHDVAMEELRRLP